MKQILFLPFSGRRILTNGFSGFLPSFLNLSAFFMDSIGSIMILINNTGKFACMETFSK